ncbi:MAG: hypothetical protein ACM31L_19985 [Actinomycetota bacterium]
MTRLPLAVAAALIVAAPAFAADKKPPACAAVNFRPVGGAMNDGTQTAGHYKSRFGSIDLLADVKGGQATYRTTVNNQPLAPFKGDIPKSAYPCLKSKHVATPPQPVGGACTGSRFRVVVDSTGKAKLVMLYALQGDDWKLCEAGTPAK